MRPFNVSNAIRGAGVCSVAVSAFVAVICTGSALAAGSMPNACPVDGCDIKIVAVERSGNELKITLSANFSPDMSKNHSHVWWGENFTVEQVSNDAKTRHKVTQGKWHPTDAYPIYTTQSAASTSVRGGAKTICVSVADRNHDILDTKVVHCVDVEKHL